MKARLKRSKVHAGADFKASASSALLFDRSENNRTGNIFAGLTRYSCTKAPDFESILKATQLIDHKRQAIGVRCQASGDHTFECE